MDQQTPTKAEMKIPHDFPTESPSGVITGSLIAAVVSGISGWLWFRRKTSRDAVEIAKDRAETDLVKILQQERDEYKAAAKEAWDRRTEDAMEIAKLTEQVKHLQQTIGALKEQIAQLVEQLSPETTQAPPAGELRLLGDNT